MSDLTIGMPNVYHWIFQSLAGPRFEKCVALATTHCLVIDQSPSLEDCDFGYIVKTSPIEANRDYQLITIFKAGHQVVS